MSVIEMIKEHPQVGADYTEELGAAVRHAMYCAAITNSCADACSAEERDMRACIRACSDTADICTALYRVAARRTAGNVAVIKALLEASTVALKACAEECAKHDNAHCRRCAKMCRETLEDCDKALATMAQEAR